MMETLDVTFPNGVTVGYEIHSERARELYHANIIVRSGIKRYEVSPNAGNVAILYALLDLNGEHLPTT